MAQRDYVRNKTNKKNKSRIMPKIMMAIALVLVVLFIAILFIVSSNKTNKPSTPLQKPTEGPQITLPEKQEERFTYLKELEDPASNQQATPPQTKSPEQEKERQQILDSFANNSTETPTVTPPAKTENEVKNQTSQTNTQQNDWLLQCGAFKDKAKADAVKAKLAIQGISSFIKSEGLHRIFAGPYQSKQEAEKVIANLKSNGISSCIIIAKK